MKYKLSVLGSSIYLIYSQYVKESMNKVVNDLSLVQKNEYLAKSSNFVINSKIQVNKSMASIYEKDEIIHGIM